MSAVNTDERQRVAGLALRLVRAHEPALEPLLRIEWSERFTRRLGDAMYVPKGTLPEWLRADNRLPPMARVRFSIPLWERAGREEQDATVAHELAHVIVYHRWCLSLLTPRFGTLRVVKPSAHGREWQRVMRELGYTPERTHSVDRTGIAKRRSPHTAHCHKCAKVYSVGPKRYRKIVARDQLLAKGSCPKNTSGYLCSCGGPRVHRFLHATPKGT